MMMMIESWPQRGGVIGDGAIYSGTRPSSSSCVLLCWSTKTHMFFGLYRLSLLLLALYIVYRGHNEAVYYREKEEEDGRGNIYSFSCFIVTPPFLSLFFSPDNTQYIHTRPPGRQVEMMPHVVGIFSIVCCSSVPFHHQNHLLLFFFFL